MTSFPAKQPQGQAGTYSSLPALRTFEEEIAAELVCPAARLFTRDTMVVLIVG